MTCSEMRFKSLKVAENLEKLGILRGDHITVVAEHSDNVLPILIGALAMGAVINPLYTGSITSKS